MTTKDLFINYMVRKNKQVAGLAVRLETLGDTLPGEWCTKMTDVGIFWRKSVQSDSINQLRFGTELTMDRPVEGCVVKNLSDYIQGGHFNAFVFTQDLKSLINILESKEI